MRTTYNFGNAKRIKDISEMHIGKSYIMVGDLGVFKITITALGNWGYMHYKRNGDTFSTSWYEFKEDGVKLYAI